ncbi:penicillin acylase family protein [Pseudoxanthomonas sp. PXM01]|uniref:penicillin acylase family protein n=1 Tax=Pseudoxanthomonas sp. PXM01 TaxID=2769295 RepID=UPI00177C252B|nr:penicillin acylase family protein [Pseudoxanthomonas sp. PXM01]MBD9468435.1 penicillin acylase family protein [Pseudoxanthomonas sp. PXM01]
MLKWTRRIALLLLTLVVVALLVAWWLMRGSLARLDGEQALPGLSAPVSIQRDALGVVTIEAASETDAVRALGFVHAQERYFEMDLMRRSSAGELSGLFGSIAVDMDTSRRMHRMRARATASLDGFAGDRMPQLQAYADGVNDGLSALKSRPWPYLLLRQSPRAWEVADSALAGYAMYFDLQDADNVRELGLWKIRRQVPPALYALLTHDGTEWDAPLQGEPRGNAPLPTADQVDLRTLPMPETGTHQRLADKGTPGSNNWAVAGALTADGRAIVADDMHLGLRAPNIWFRVRLRYPDPRAPGGKVDVSGFSLPGLPAIIVGSNGHVAWGFTNSYADTADWYPVKPCGKGDAAETCDAVEHHAETIEVAGAEPVTLDVPETRYGPIIHAAKGKQPALALRWVAHQPGSLNFGLADFAAAGDLSAALSVAQRTATPAQNLVIADHNGRIAWRILGPLPSRAASCPHTLELAPAAPGDDAAPLAPGSCRPWVISSQLSPVLTSQTSHRLWTANARVLDGAALERVGDGGYALGARAQQIRDGLLAKERFTEQDLLAIQLDDRALFLQRWWQLLQDEAKRLPADSSVKALADAGKTWEGVASVDSVSYRLVRAWRLAVHARIADGLTAPAQAALGDDFVMPDLPQLEGAVWPLLEQRPAHLLSRRYKTWDALLEDAAKEVRDDLADQGPLAERRWGERNTAKICHPLANALPAFLKPKLCMPGEPLAGDGAMPRVQGPAFGASERMVVSPGHEADGIIHMPGGQSGHPMSPFWGAGHDDWVHGRPTPFLPGAATHTLTLRPTNAQPR